MKKLIYILLAVASPLCLWADNSADINELINSIVANNIGIKAAGISSDAEKAALESSNNLSDPELDFTHQWGQDGIGNKWSVGVSQSFEWPGVYSARKDMIRSQHMALDRLQNAKVHSLRLEVTKAVLENIYLRQMESLRRDQLSRIDSLLEIYRKGVDQGEISVLDLNKLKIERVNVHRSLNESINQVNENIESIIALNGGETLGSNINNIAGFPECALLPMESYVALALRNDPDISYNEAMADALKFESRTLNRSLIPGFSVGYSHDYELGEHFNGISLGLTIPAFSTRHKKSEIQSRQIANSLEMTDKENEIRSSIRKAYALVANLDKELENYGEALFDMNNFRLLDIALAAGHISLIEYLTQVNYFLDATEGYIDMNYRRALAFAELNQWNY